MIYFVIGGILLAGSGIPLMLRKIKPDRVIPVQSLEEEGEKEKGYQMLAAIGRRLLSGGVGIVLAALVLFFWPGLELTTEEYVLSVSGAAAGLMLWVGLQSYLSIKSRNY